MFLCIPIVYGCPAKLSQEGHDTRYCPRCNNPSVEPIKKSKRFELCYLPLIPLGKKQLWFCPTCQWQAPRGEGQPEPAPVGGQKTTGHQYYQGGAPSTGGGAPPAGRGYDVGYGGQGQKQQN